MGKGICKASIMIGDKIIGLVEPAMIVIDGNTIAIGTNNTFDMVNILELLKSNNITVQVKSRINLNDKMHTIHVNNWLIFKNEITVILNSIQLCQKD